MEDAAEIRGAMVEELMGAMPLNRPEITDMIIRATACNINSFLC